jgi:TPP-dependent pyruvate/acetoin dehydrogenase alpha subunit
MAEKIKRSGKIAIVFIGDGTLGEGVVYESLNIASLWSAPILFVVENNQIAQTTPAEIAIAGSIPGRFNSFGIQTSELHSSDVLEINKIAGDLIDEIRQKNSPSALILNTHRFGPHSKGDDTRHPDEVNKLREKWDPVSTQATRLSEDQKSMIIKEIDNAVSEAFDKALNDPFPDIELLTSCTSSSGIQGSDS